MKDFLGALKNKKRSGKVPVIPDVKCFSPKEGELMKGRDPVEYAKTLVAAGAPVLSVVTEEKEFHGSMEMLRAICHAVDVPILRKDFIEEVKDLDETVDAGASAILLMVACLGEEKLKFLYEEALKRGLMPLVETHTQDELDFARALQAPFIGINNRNILQLERDDGDVSLAKSLLQIRDDSKDAFIVVESSLKDAKDVRTAIRSGAGAALVGTALLQAEDPVKLYRAMCRPVELKICGVMNLKDAKLCADHYTDVIGFVTEYPVPVPWDIPRETAKELIGQIRGRAKTCIVTGGSIEKIVTLAKELRPDQVQIHYREPLADVLKVTEELHRSGIEVIRSIPSDEEMRREMFGTADVAAIIDILSGSPVDSILLDSRDAGNAAVGGKSILAGINRDICDAVSRSIKPIMVGGGITAENAAEVLGALDADCIDVMTGVETNPGNKSEDRIAALAAAMA